jgi:hypothetical protein
MVTSKKLTGLRRFGVVLLPANWPTRSCAALATFLPTETTRAELLPIQLRKAELLPIQLWKRP